LYDITQELISVMCEEPQFCHESKLMFGYPQFLLYSSCFWKLILGGLHLVFDDPRWCQRSKEKWDHHFRFERSNQKFDFIHHLNFHWVSAKEIGRNILFA
jgi:hypothetical protein